MALETEPFMWSIISESTKMRAKGGTIPLIKVFEFGISALKYYKQMGIYLFPCIKIFRAIRKNIVDQTKLEVSYARGEPAYT